MTDRVRSAWWSAVAAFISLSLTLGVAEIVVRIVDPLPYFSPAEINHTEHGNLSEYDSLLGWRGVPGGAAVFVTANQRVWVQHNQLGFRDIEHDVRAGKPSIVFLGDSYTWGYEVEFDEMFVNRLRRRLPQYEIFNLAHRGYGTDQSLLTFRQWRYDGPLRWVVLMFTHNDVDDNNSTFRYLKPKPRFELVGGEFSLRGIPVPRTPAWGTAGPRKLDDLSLKARVKRLPLSSHIASHFYQRVWMFWRYPGRTHVGPAPVARQRADTTEADRADRYATTRWLLARLKQEVEERGGTPLVGLIGSQGEVEGLNRERDITPHRVTIAAICGELGIASFELATLLKASWFRVHYPFAGGHWNARGHRIAANAIYDYLSSNGAAR